MVLNSNQFESDNLDRYKILRIHIFHLLYALSCVLGQLWGAAWVAKWHFFSSKLQWTSPSCSPLCGEDRRACWCSSALHWCWARERCSHIQVKATAFGPPLGVIKIEPYLALSIFLLLFIFIAVVAVIRKVTDWWRDDQMRTVIKHVPKHQLSRIRMSVLHYVRLHQLFGGRSYILH